MNRARTSPQSPSFPVLPDLSTPPAPGDVDGQVSHVRDVLTALERLGTPDAKELRAQMITAVEAYGEEENPIVARREARESFRNIELAAHRLLERALKKMYDKMVHACRRVGRVSAEGHSLRKAAEGLDRILGAVGMMQEALERDDEALRQRAASRLAQAQASLGAMA